MLHLLICFMVHRIQHLLETGLIEKWYYKYIKPKSHTLECADHLTRKEAVTLTDTLYVFLYVLVVGLTIALTVLILEIALYRYFAGGQIPFGTVAPVFSIIWKNIPE